MERELGPIVYCVKCKVQTRTTILNIDVEYDGQGDKTGRLVFSRCPSCGSPFLLLQAYGGVDYAHGLEYDVWAQPDALYPTPGRSIPADLPPLVDAGYREAIRCEQAEAWLATAVMVGRTLEAVAVAETGSKAMLAKGWKEMRDQGIISDELAEWGDELRYLRNIAAHPTEKAVTEQDAREALDFLEAIVETIYVLRVRFKAMKARRTAAAS